MRFESITYQPVLKTLISEEQTNSCLIGPITLKGTGLVCHKISLHSTLYWFFNKVMMYSWTRALQKIKHFDSFKSALLVYIFTIYYFHYEHVYTNQGIICLSKLNCMWQNITFIFPFHSRLSIAWNDAYLTNILLH